MSPSRSLLLVLIVCTAACGGGGGAPDASAVQGVAHLDPRLADGRSSADVLGAERTVVATWTLRKRKLEDTLASWELRHADVRPGRDGSGIRVRPAEGHATEIIDFLYQRELDADGFNVLEVDGIFAPKGAGLVTWGNEQPVPGVRPQDKRVSVPPRAVRGVQTLRFSLGEHPGWTGAITRLRLAPITRGAQSYQLQEIRFVREGFRPGAQQAVGDGGLVGFDGDLRRTWPSDDGVPLFARVEVPRGGRLAVDTALMGSWHGLEDEVHFAVDARADGGAWSEVARRDFTPAKVPGAGRWRSLTGDLAAFAGRSTELRLRAWRGAGAGERAGEGGTLRAARFLWGKPLVLGELHADRRPNVLLVTLDTLRADALGVQGGSPDTPALDGLAAGGLWFSDAWSACNSTLPSHVSILTGLEVPTHGALDNRSQLADGVQTLAQGMRAAGYHTAAAVSVGHLAAGYSGLGRGFDQYQDMLPGSTTDGARTLERALAWLDDWRAEGERPWFLWVHLFDPHTPYGPPNAFFAEYAARVEARGGVPPKTVVPATIGGTTYTAEGQFLAGVNNLDYARFAYDAGVAYTDTLVAQLLADLADAGDAGRTVVAVTADHGESLGEHEIYFNHSKLYPESVHVPLLLRVPGGPRGRVDARASGVDLAPTLARLAGVDGLRSDGVDLLELVGGGARGRERRVHFVHSALFQIGCRDGQQHFIASRRDVAEMEGGPGITAGQAELFRSADDAACAIDLAGAEPALAAEYAAAMQAWLDQASTGLHVQADATSADEQALDDLGYGGGDDGDEDDAEDED